jgi:hypothetical protein
VGLIDVAAIEVEPECVEVFARFDFAKQRAPELCSDFTEAYKQAGLTKAQVKSIGKYTWHHLDDFDPVTGKGTMQLVMQSAHKASLPHTGSVAQFEKYFGLPSGSYGIPEAIAISQDKG